MSDKQWPDFLNNSQETLKDINAGECHWTVWTRREKIASGTLKFKHPKGKGVPGRISAIINQIHRQAKEPILCTYEVMTAESVSLYRTTRGDFPGKNAP